VLVVVERAGPQAVVRVKDDGAGIGAEMLAVLFQPFMQADRTLDRSRGGLGLGLALVKGIIDLHEGTVEARSDGEGKGAEFIVRMPIADEALALPSPSRARPSVARRRVLVVEDNEDAAATLRDFLVLDGHEVFVAFDGQQGLDLAAKVRPEVVLCDVGLPVLDGYEVARRLRSAGSTAMLVAVTGYAAQEDAARAQQAGFDHHLAKPMDPDKLTALLAALSVPAR
jgi:CheY-like chemotaxis protein